MMVMANGSCWCRQPGVVLERMAQTNKTPASSQTRATRRQLSFIMSMVALVARVSHDAEGQPLSTLHLGGSAPSEVLSKPLASCRLGVGEMMHARLFGRRLLYCVLSHALIGRRLQGCFEEFLLASRNLSCPSRLEVRVEML